MGEEKTVVIEYGMVKNLPTMVIHALAEMSEQNQLIFVEEYKRKKKSVGLAYLFFLLLFGLQYGYLGKWGLQILYWILGICFNYCMIDLLNTLISPLGGTIHAPETLIALFLPALVFFFWGIYLLFALPGLVRDYNKDIAKNVIQEIKIMGL